MSGKAIAATLAALAFACLLAIGVLFAAGAQAEETTPKCAKRADLIKWLDKNYHEVAVAIGMINDQSMMEMYVSATGTWTLLLTGTNGVSCMLADGDNWTFSTAAFDKAKKGEEM